MQEVENIMSGIDAPDGTEFMSGTGGTLDYVIIGHKDSFKIGLRPLYSPHGPMVGFRVRVMWNDDTVPMNFPETVKMSFPGTPFGKLTSIHASLVGGMKLYGEEQAIPMTADNLPPTETLIEVMEEQQTVTKVLESLTKVMEFEVDEGIPEFLTKAYGTLMGAVNGDGGKAKAVTSGEAAEVVPFTPKGETNDEVCDD